MKKQLANAIIFLAVTSSALITGRLYSVSQNTPSKLNNSQDISLSKNYKSYEHLLPLFEKAKEASNNLRYEETIETFKEILKEIPSLDISNDQKEINIASALLESFFLDNC